MNFYKIWTMRRLKNILSICIDVFLIIPLLLTAIYGRYKKKEFDIGFGSIPLINSIYHKKAMKLYGYKVQTFAAYTWFITSDFDVVFCKDGNNYLKKVIGVYRTIFHSLLHYKCLFIYSNGVFMLRNPIISALEPYLLKLSNTKIVTMQYGADVQLLERTKNFLFKNMACKDYPQSYIYRYGVADIRREVDKWTRFSNHIISGNDWIEYVPFWNTLMLSHFAYDVKNTPIAPIIPTPDEYILLHAPNHRNIKGTQVFIDAVEVLKSRGYNVRLQLLEKLPNNEILKAIDNCFLVCDQLVIGWYAMFAIEAMSRGKPCVCYIREDFKDFYTKTGLIEKGELPLINCEYDVESVADAIEELIKDKAKYIRTCTKSREFVEKHHSLEYIGSVFDSIYKQVVK